MAAAILDLDGSAAQLRDAGAAAVYESVAELCDRLADLESLARPLARHTS
jgi:hypothetical protein